METNTFIESENYKKFVGSDVDFPTEETVDNIIQYLLSKYQPIRIAPNQEHEQSDIHFFSYNYYTLKRELDKNGNKMKIIDFTIDWKYPTLKKLYSFVKKNDDDDSGSDDDSDDDDWDDGEDDETIMPILVETLKSWLSMLKISLLMEPFDESLKYQENTTLFSIPRLSQDESELGFKFKRSYENVKTREETVLYIIQQMAQVYKERGNTHGYNKWIEFCTIHLQSAIKTPLVKI